MPNIEDGNKILSKIIVWTLSEDFIIPEQLSKEFNLSEETTRNTLSALMNLNLINADPNGFFIVTVTEFADLNPEILQFLTKNGYTEDDIMNVIDVPDNEKEESSVVLTMKHEWNAIEDVAPIPNRSLVIRIRHKTKTIRKMKKAVAYVEDLKLATFDGKEWHINPPYNKYDFSPISNKDKIDDDAIVTHWAIPGDDDLKFWDGRFNMINEYNELALHVDEEHEPIVYDGLIMAGAAITEFIKKLSKEDPLYGKMSNAYNVICDLQSVIDVGGSYNKEEK